MSYRFTMGFKTLKKDQLMDFCIDVTESMFTHANTIIEDNLYYIPSNRYHFGDNDQRQITDKMWLNHLFTINFVYWEDKKLLSIAGDATLHEIKSMFDNWFDFQNSCDQDYDYTCWNGIEYFEQVVDRTKGLSANDLTNMKDYASYSIKELNDDLDYMLKSHVYKTIYKELDLNSWLWGKNGYFKRFSFNAITSQERLLDAYILLKELKKKNN